MKKLLVRALALLLALAVGAPATAQLLPPLPGGSLIVTLTSPSGGSTVSGTVPVSASVSIVGTLTVSRVEFFRNGNLIGSDSGAPYSVSWNTTTASNGSHTLSAVAVDVLGVRWTSNSVTVNVSNGPPPDTSAPNVSITSPGNGATVSGTINVTASAADNVGVTSVQFRLDGVNAGTPDTSAPYSIAWNTTASGNGSHTISAVARDAAGNTRTSAPVTVTVANDTTRPAVTINQASGQADPSSSSAINFTVIFSEPVSGFSGGDVSIGGTAGGTKTRSVTGGPSTYNVAVGGMTTGGTVIATIGAGAAQDAAGNTSTASTSSDNTVTWTPPDTTRPAVTINQASGQADPTSTSPIKFTVVFSESVNGFTGSDVTIGGTAGGAKTVTLTCGSNTYCVEVRGMTTGGTVIATVAAGVATDAAGNTNTASTSTDNTVTWSPPDTTAPTASITSPADGATVSGMISVTASASDNVGVVGVEFLVDGVVRADDTSSPYSVSWDTTTVSDGSHTLSAIARDAAGNRTTSAPVIVTVSNAPPADTTPPTVSVTSPADGATVSGTISVTASASDNVGVTGVQFLLDGTAAGPVLTVAPYGIPFDTTAVSDGTHTIAAQAADAAGNRTTSAPVTVTVSNGTGGGDTTPPTVSVTSPADGATVSGTITVAASATDDVGVDRVEFLLDGAVAATDTTSPYSVPWDTTTVSDGTHTIAARAFDAAGNAATSATITVTASNGTSADTTPPAVSVSSPADGATVSGAITVAASATDNVGVTGVQFLLDGTAAGPVLTVAPYEIPFDTTAVSDGTHTIAAQAADAAGNIATSATITVTVRNGGNITPIEQDDPAVSYAGTWVRDEANSIASGGTFSESNAAGATLTLSFTGTEVRWLGYRFAGGGIARISVDGTFEGEVNTYSASPVLGEVFRASGLPAGSHTLTIEVTGTADPAALDSWIIVDAFDVVTSP